MPEGLWSQCPHLFDAEVVGLLKLNQSSSIGCVSGPNVWGELFVTNRQRQPIPCLIPAPTC